MLVTKQPEGKANPQYIMVGFSEGLRLIFICCLFVNSNRFETYYNTNKKVPVFMYQTASTGQSKTYNMLK